MHSITEEKRNLALWHFDNCRWGGGGGCHAVTRRMLVKIKPHNPIFNLSLPMVIRYKAEQVAKFSTEQIVNMGQRRLIVPHYTSAVTN